MSFSKVSVDKAGCEGGRAACELVFILVLMEISQVPHENQDLHCRVSLLETQLSQLFNDNLALQEQCDALTARVKFLEDSVENNAASSNPKMVSTSSKCRKQ